MNPADYNSHSTIAKLSEDIDLADANIVKIETTIKILQERLTLVRRCRNSLATARQSMQEASGLIAQPAPRVNSAPVQLAK